MAKPGEIKNTPKYSVHKNFTLIELLVVVALIGILVSILMPALAKAREAAKRAVCKSNQSQILKGMYLYSKGHNGRVPIGATSAYFRYAFSLWDKNKFNISGEGHGWMALGYIYNYNNMTSMDSWDCPSRKGKGWQKPRVDRWPPGEDSNIFSHSAYSVRTDSRWVWTNYRQPDQPFISELESDMAYISDTFAGSDVYQDRHGDSGINIFGKISGSVIGAKKGPFYNLAIGNGKYNTVNNSTMETMWGQLDEVSSQ